MFDIHFNRKKLPIKAAREARELYAICRGDLTTDPEFSDKYGNLKLPQSNISKSPNLSKNPSYQLLKDLNTYIADTPINEEINNFKSARSLTTMGVNSQ